MSSHSIGRHQGPLVFLVAGLPAAFLFDLGFRGAGLACGCCVLGGSEEFCGVLPFTCRSSSSTRASNSRDPRQQQANDGLGFRRLAGNDFFRDYRFHAHCCATRPAFESRSLCQQNVTGV